MNIEARNAHLGYVDGLRAIAVLAVIFYHAICAAAWATPVLDARMQPTFAWWFATLASKGTHGVDLFFVISGFCLSYPSLVRQRAGSAVAFDARSFLAKRIVRIVPPYYVSIALLGAAMLVAAHYGIAKPSAVGDGVDVLAVVRQALFLDRAVPYLNNAYWTLAVEFRWYLIFPALLVLYVRAPRVFFSVMISCVLAYNFTRLRALDIATLPAFMLGIVAADWYIVPHRFAKYATLGLFVAVDIALLLEPFSSAPNRFGGPDEVGFYVQTNPGWQLASFCFVVVAGRPGVLRRLLSLPVLTTIGAAAYGIYLAHMPIISAWGEHAGAGLNPVANIASSVALALAGGMLFSYVAERPFLGGRIRTWMLRFLAAPLDRVFAVSGLPATFALASPMRLPQTLEISPEEPPILAAPTVG